MASERPLYIFLRTDMESMTGGRAIAQACHVANQAVKDIRRYGGEQDHQALDEWESQADGFGTTLIMNGGSANDLERLYNIDLDDENKSVWIGLVYDPEYYITDGETRHLLKDVLVGMYAFPYSDDWEFMNKYELY